MVIIRARGEPPAARAHHRRDGRRAPTPGNQTHFAKERPLFEHDNSPWVVTRCPDAPGPAPRPPQKTVGVIGCAGRTILAIRQAVLRRIRAMASTQHQRIPAREKKSCTDRARASKCPDRSALMEQISGICIKKRIFWFIGRDPKGTKNETENRRRDKRARRPKAIKDIRRATRKQNTR